MIFQCLTSFNFHYKCLKERETLEKLKNEAVAKLPRKDIKITMKREKEKRNNLDRTCNSNHLSYVVTVSFANLQFSSISEEKILFSLGYEIRIGES